MSSRILITGGFGYLGGRIAVELSELGSFQVRLTSRKKLRPPDWLSQADTSQLNVLNPDTFPAALKDIDAVIHLASLNEHECAANPDQAFLVNTVGTVNLLEAAIEAGVDRFLYFSTAHVYGSPLAGDISEDSVPRPIHPYALTHRAAEDFILAAHDQEKIMGVVLRLSNGFGAPSHPAVNRWTLLVNDLCRQVVRTQKMILHSDGRQLRDFIPLTDVCQAVLHFLTLPRSECGDGLFNLGSGTSSSVLEMTNRIAGRYQLLFSRIPAIEKRESENTELHSHFILKTDKLVRSGFERTGDPDVEIDETLIMCAESLNKMN